ncbi:MAG: 3-oxoacyl-ACP reductase FabG [Clostridiales bacterium]|nr:3-oxoacyl-ACP reductase FabG [Clostridiales bacterium]
MRNVVITGGTRGIGAACTRLFTQKGDRVFALYQRNDTAAEQIAAETGAVTIRADVSKESEVLAAAEKIHKYGDCDVLINNAGIARIKLFTEITADEWDRMFSVNVRGAFLVTKAFLPDMINKKSGKIINVSSMWGQTGASCEVHYSASKAALIGFTKALAKEVGLSGICVNCVCPGVIDTEMNKELDADVMAELMEEIPLNKIGSAEEAANSIFFLASDKAGYITGQVLGVNGGMVI